MLSKGRRQLGSVGVTLIKEKIKSLLFIGNMRNLISSIHYVLC